MVAKTIIETESFLKKHKGLIDNKVKIDILFPFPYKRECIFYIEDQPVMKIKGNQQDILKLFFK